MELDIYMNNNLSDIVFCCPLCLCALVRVYFFAEQCGGPTFEALTREAE